eukprot:CAMPEP_0198362520 /NCGR_PEP_ID=MMETSP1450-20131203/146325_1 /TAXON_ID=753684 ORGANISM="Madagascaria erythrocladiodes, Strain CCMP3234" /NCGR_SAMPLE_ID=MMETSP1450 /ASSEMBLY_ACC=CAM_ASM_001115 /LENGTH=308 /DNA_ID=CAMNT_0044069739 /DNA_START=54 /DNA_END=976 /DNA_ORIENTATION=+
MAWLSRKLESLSLAVERKRAEAEAGAFEWVTSYETGRQITKIRELLIEGFEDLSASDVAAGVVLVQAYHEHRLKHPPPNTVTMHLTADNDDDLIFARTAARFLRFSCACYGAPFYHGWLNNHGEVSSVAKAIRDSTAPQLSNRQVMTLMTDVPDNDIIECDWKSGEKGRVGTAAYCVCIDRQTRSLVVAFRGTLDIHDGLRDLCAQGVDFDLADGLGGKGKVHEGIMGAVVEFDKMLTPRIRAWMQYDSYGQDFDSVVLCGHSLGAGVASLYHILLRRAFDGRGAVYDKPTDGRGDDDDDDDGGGGGG